MANTYDQWKRDLYNVMGDVAAPALWRARGLAETGMGGWQDLRPTMYDSLTKYWKTAYEGPQAMQGYSPETMAALKARAVETLPEGYNEAMRNLKLAALRRGGGYAGGATPGYLPGMASLLGAREWAKSGAMRDVIVGNEQQKMQMYRDMLSGMQPYLTTMLGHQGQLFDLAKSGLAGELGAGQLYGGLVPQPKQADLQGGSFWKTLLAAGIGAGTDMLTGGAKPWILGE